AESGRLGIYEWLRYPWFPYNYQLLYAAALQVDGDTFPHLLNALAGWLGALLVYRLGARHADRATAALGAAIWLVLGDYSDALIDLGVALFVLAACVALWRWRESARGKGLCWLALGAFFLGVAAGSKYQALTFLPPVALFVVLRERRPRAWLLAAAAFLLPCVYWYARNAVATGDPFNPIGARVFGFTNWNAFDYAQQLADVRAHAAWPSVLIWPVLLAPFSAAWKSSAALRAAGWLCVWSVLVWVATSRYPRYLTAAYPLLALMSAVGWGVLARWLWARASATLRRPAALRTGTLWVLLAGVALASLQQSRSTVVAIAVTPAERTAFLRQAVPGYAVMDYLRQHAGGRVYQIALSEAIYYGPTPVWGDAIGPWRYIDFITLPPAEMAAKLSRLGFTAIALPTTFLPLLEKSGFEAHFKPMYDADHARAYRIIPPAP
ncbi:MAG: putative transrane protein, partial [Variovorax sp.]|nr:putative transrane protein [Variovorax sp.]